MRQIDAGMGLSELTAFTAETWGCSRRNARDVVCAAHKDWLDAAYGSEEIDQKDWLFQQVGRLEGIANVQRAIEEKAGGLLDEGDQLIQQRLWLQNELDNVGAG